LEKDARGSLSQEAFEVKGVITEEGMKNLKTYFIWLEQQEYIEENKLKKIPRCADELNEQPVLSEAQIKMIIAQLHTRRQRTLERLRNVFFIDILRLTGARPSELLSMRVEDIRPNKNSFQVVIRGKKQKGRIRYYNMPSWARDSYIAYMQFRKTLKNRDDDDSLFISQSNKKGWTQKGMRNLFRRLSKELGFRITAYCFRRFTATYLNEKGVGLDKIQDYLGHTRASTTKRYIARTGKLTQQGVDVIAEVFRS